MKADALRDKLIEAEEKTKKILNQIEQLELNESEKTNTDDKLNKMLAWMQTKDM
jgi:hypothetical protein